MDLRRPVLAAAVVASAVGAGAALGSAPAFGAVVARDSFSDGYDFVTYDCGVPVRIQGEFTVSVQSRQDATDPTVFFDHQRFSFREVWTNTLSGDSFVERGSSTLQELTARQVEGTVYEYSVVFAGQPYVVEDGDGNVVARDQGSRRLKVLFDTGGDQDPGKDGLEVVDFREAGLSDASANDDCRYVADLAGIGSASSERYSLHPTGTTDSPLGYGEYLPPSYGSGGASPLLVFLHGAGEGGNGSAEDLTHLAWNAIPRYLANDLWPEDRPFVVLAPQHDDTVQPPEYGDDYGACDGQDYPGSCWLTVQHQLGNPTPGSPCFTPVEVRNFIDYAVAAYDVDPARVYVTGLSCGGYGAWEYLAENGGTQVAAAVPIAGEGRPAWETAGCGLASVPVWAFHGALDDVVDPQGSIVPVTGLRETCGVPEADAGLTIYPDLDHGSWDTTYSLGGPHDIYSWLLARSSA